MTEDNNIIKLTDAAQAHIKSFLTSMKEGSGFRVDIKQTGCSGYAYLVDVVEAPREGDIVTKQNELKLFIGPKYVDLLRGTLIDYQQKDANQKQLVFNNPNSDAYCGCGESFTIKKDKSE
ncbi:MAG: sufA [Gammaproteobacteria bacterium]|jgi:iron-sulfur cluster assembly accessory protein|nr:sufA [Gammaproteobacteria bacterium]